MIENDLKIKINTSEIDFYVNENNFSLKPYLSNL